jgi:hypothetical protein
MYKRIFTFGCSFTRFSWPTWADITAWDLNIPIQNWGLSGIGNVGIFHRMVECDLRNKFDKDDLIMVLWSHWHREDRYIRHWQTHGNIFHEEFYDSNFIKKYWSLENDIVKNSTAIISANKMFNINFQSNITPLLKFESNARDLTQKENNMFQFYKQFIPFDTVFNYNNHEAFDHYKYDDHPTVLQHLNFLTDTVYPALNLKIKRPIINLCNNIHQDIIDKCPLPKDKDLAPIITEMIRKKYDLHYREPVGF